MDKNDDWDEATNVAIHKRRFLLERVPQDYVDESDQTTALV